MSPLGGRANQGINREISACKLRILDETWCFVGLHAEGLPMVCFLGLEGIYEHAKETK
jgi:hypothetical protein